MAAPSGNMPADGGAEMIPYHPGTAAAESAHAHHLGGPMVRHQWVPDQRDGFIGWLLSEFAASNAIIDLLLEHLRMTAEYPGEYDQVNAAVGHRRCNWVSSTYMQQYYTVAHVSYALQQATWQRQRQHHAPFHHPRSAGDKDTRRSGYGYRPVQGHRFRPTASSDGERKVDTRIKVETTQLSQSKMSNNAAEKEDAGLTDTGSTQSDCCSINGEHINERIKLEPVDPEDCHAHSRGSSDDSPSKCSGTMPNQNEKQQSIVSESPVGNEIIDGKLVNVVDGLRLYEDLFDSSQVTKLVTMAKELKNAGRRGELQGRTLVSLKRPMKGHGREIIQLGVSIVNRFPEDESLDRTSRESRVEAIPHLLQEIMDRLIQLQILNAKPNFCVIDFFNEGDHSQPQLWPLLYGRPLCRLFLTDCDVVFGHVIEADQMGYKGSLKLSLKPGSLLVLQGNSIELSRQAIPSVRKQRIILTFGHHPSPWSQPPVKAPPSNYNRISPPGTKKYGIVVARGGVLSTPAAGCAQHLPPPVPNGVQPLFLPPVPMTPAPVPYPVSVPLSPSSAVGWTMAATPPPRHHHPRAPLPGTGVFLPPSGSGQWPTLHPQDDLSLPSDTAAAAAYKMTIQQNGSRNDDDLAETTEPPQQSSTAEERTETNSAAAAAAAALEVQ